VFSDTRIVNGELERMWQEMGMVCFKELSILFQEGLGWTTKNE